MLLGALHKSTHDPKSGPAAACAAAHSTTSVSAVACQRRSGSAMLRRDERLKRRADAARWPLRAAAHAQKPARQSKPHCQFQTRQASGRRGGHSAKLGDTSDGGLACFFEPSRSRLRKRGTARRVMRAAAGAQRASAAPSRARGAQHAPHQNRHTSAQARPTQRCSDGRRSASSE